MGRVFNTTGVCIPEKHYMVNINGRLQQIRVLVDEGKYFTINMRILFCVCFTETVRL